MSYTRLTETGTRPIFVSLKATSVFTISQSSTSKAKFISSKAGMWRNKHENNTLLITFLLFSAMPPFKMIAIWDFLIRLTLQETVISRHEKVLIVLQCLREWNCLLSFCSLIACQCLEVLHFFSYDWPSNFMKPKATKL